MTIGEKIKKARTDAKMTQKELAEKCGMADSAIRKYESGKVTPKLDTIAKIARAMGLYAGDLVDAGQWGQVQPGEDSETASAAESQLIYHFRTLNDNGQTVAVNGAARPLNSEASTTTTEDRFTVSWNWMNRWKFS